MKMYVRKRTDQRYDTMLSLIDQSRTYFINIELYKKLLRCFWKSCEAYQNGQSYTQEIQSSLWIRQETIVSGTGLRRNPTFSLTKPVGSDLDFIGFLAARFRTGSHRKRSHRFLSNLTIGSYRIQPDLAVGKYQKKPDSGKNLSRFHRILVTDPPTGLRRKNSA